MKTLLVLLGVFCLGNALEFPIGKMDPRHACGVLEAFPYFKATDVNIYKNTKVPSEEVNKLRFMVELSRFINGKAPALLQEFAQTKKIFVIKKKIAKVEHEAILRQKLMHQTRTVRSAEKKSEFSWNMVKLISTECANLMKKFATGLDSMVQSRIDPEFQLLVRALSTCGSFMTNLSVGMQRQMQAEDGFKSLPLNLPYASYDIKSVKDALAKVSEDKSFIQTLQEQDSKQPKLPKAFRACTEDTAADDCTEDGMLGTCNAEGNCECNEGFTGEDCTDLVEEEPETDEEEPETDEEEPEADEEETDLVDTVGDVIEDGIDAVKPIVGQASEFVGDILEGVINTFESSTSLGFEFVNELIESVGDVIENTFSSNPHWDLICLATWWPLQEEHCRAARCAVCSPGVLSAMSICKSAYQRVDHKCVQEVMGEGFCNYCIADFLP